jgi:hypothetical protein
LHALCHVLCFMRCMARGDRWWSVCYQRSFILFFFLFNKKKFVNNFLYCLFT